MNASKERLFIDVTGGTACTARFTCFACGFAFGFALALGGRWFISWELWCADFCIQLRGHGSRGTRQLDLGSLCRIEVGQQVSTGGTVRLIADNEVKGRKILVGLSLVNNVKRLVGREDDCHAAVFWHQALELFQVGLEHFGRQALGVGGGREA